MQDWPVADLLCGCRLEQAGAVGEDVVDSGRSGHSQSWPDVAAVGAAPGAKPVGRHCGPECFAGCGGLVLKVAPAEEHPVHLVICKTMVVPSVEGEAVLDETRVIRGSHGDRPAFCDSSVRLKLEVLLPEWPEPRGRWFASQKNLPESRKTSLSVTRCRVGGLAVRDVGVVKVSHELFGGDAGLYRCAQEP